MPSTCSATRCATCSIRACAAADDKEEIHEPLPAFDCFSFICRFQFTCANGKAAVRRHPADHHLGADAVGALLGSAGMALEAELGYGAVSRATLRRRPRQEHKEGRQAPLC